MDAYLDASKYLKAFEEARRLSALNMSLELGKLNLDDSSCSEEEDDADKSVEEEKVKNDEKPPNGDSTNDTVSKEAAESTKVEDVIEEKKEQN